MKNIVLLNDLPGYGKVALSASNPILTSMGYNVLNIPTALISNTLDFGKFEILDTTEYMKNTFSVWNKLMFPIDVISTGFIANKEQASFLVDLCREKSKQGALVFCDPIMADHGKLYNGMTEEKVKLMREMVSVSDYCTPNYTEAVFLTNSEYIQENLSSKDIKNLIDKMRDIGAKSVIITSLETEGKSAVAGYDENRNEYFTVFYEKIPISFPGTGDIFSALVIGELLKEKSLETSVSCAVDIIWKLIDKNRDSENKHFCLLTTFLEEKKNA